MLMVLLSACASKKIKLEFSLTQSASTTYTVAYYASDSRQGFFMETAISLIDGKAVQELPMVNPALLLVSSGDNRIAVYARRGDKIEISGDNPSPYTWSVGGNDINEQWSEWRRANSRILTDRDYKAINRAVATFVKGNTDNPLSTLMLLIDFNRREDEALFKQLWSSLGDKALEQKWIDLVGRNDMLTNSPQFGNRSAVRLIPLKSLARGADTIKIGKTPVFLYFWRTDDRDYSEMLDSMKAMRKRNPDSTKFIIADVCFDPDSMSWSSQAARDSLRRTIRAWNPRGETDSLMRVLGVDHTPCVVTFNMPAGK